MTVGGLIKQYREEHVLSQRQFALRCNISNGYISMLEKGINPKTNEPIMPSVSVLKAISNAMDITLNELLLQVDDMPVSLSSELGLQPSGDDGHLLEFVDLFQKLTDKQQRTIIASMKGILANYQDQDD